MAAQYVIDCLVQRSPSVCRFAKEFSRDIAEALACRFDHGNLLVIPVSVNDAQTVQIEPHRQTTEPFKVI